MIPFRRYIPTDRAELKAVLFALVICGLFITFLTAVHEPSPRIRKASYNELVIPTPAAPDQLRQLSDPPPPADLIEEEFREVPEHFKNVDFKNYSYGPYALPNGGTLDLTLYNGELTLPLNPGWFSFRDVYYKDVTGDGKAEAIVRLSHVECGVSCDGGTNLFYIYAVQNGRLKRIWEYETGSYAYGCGLKTFIVADKQLVLQLFGHCPKQGTDYPGPSKFVVEDFTYILFEFNGRRFVRNAIEFFPTPPTNVMNYQPTIRIF